MVFRKARLVLHTRSLDRMEGFYERALRLHRIASWDRPDSRGILLEATPTLIIEIIAAPGDPREETIPRAVALMLEVEDASAEYERLCAIGVSPTGAPTLRPW